MGILRSKNAVGYFYRDISTLWDRGSDGSCNIVGRDGLWNYRSYFIPQASSLGNPLLHANAALSCCCGRGKQNCHFYLNSQENLF